ncbi:MAG: urease accessory protein UreF [Kastovskya adunca ATA6-11-RM4]|jgi:urease accessory protein|nr:urease accessory protein UreF [Kastovskya adunca ATA6-11-RM4]
MTHPPSGLNTDRPLLHLLQLASPALPVGAYSYSEGLEMLVERGVVEGEKTLRHWLERELRVGAVRLEAAVMVRSYRSLACEDLAGLGYWNDWASAARETAELRSQSWQMGRSLMRLLIDLQPSLQPIATAVGSPCNYAIAFGIAAAHWQIDLHTAVLGYLHSWTSNLVSAGVKLIPLGQTAGQKLLLNLYADLSQAAEEVLLLDDEVLGSCGWGLAIASMAHETQYTRLFRS